MNFQDDFSSILIDNFKNNDVLVFDLTAMKDANENCRYLEFVGEAPRLELNVTFPLKHVTDFIEVGKQMFSIANDKFGDVGKKFQKRQRCSPANTQSYPSTQVSVP